MKKIKHFLAMKQKKKQQQSRKQNSEDKKKFGRQKKITNEKILIDSGQTKYKKIEEKWQKRRKNLAKKPFLKQEEKLRKFLEVKKKECRNRKKLTKIKFALKIICKKKDLILTFFLTRNRKFKIAFKKKKKNHWKIEMRGKFLDIRQSFGKQNIITPPTFLRTKNNNHKINNRQLRFEKKWWSWNLRKITEKFLLI